MKRILELREKAKKELRTIVLPEGEDKRVVKAAGYIASEKLAKIILLGNKDDVLKLAKEQEALRKREEAREELLLQNEREERFGKAVLTGGASLVAEAVAKDPVKTGLAIATGGASLVTEAVVKDIKQGKPPSPKTVVKVVKDIFKRKKKKK